MQAACPNANLSRPGPAVEAWHHGGLSGHAELIVGGAGPEIENIRRLAADDPSIRIMGYVPDGELPALYRDADIFVLPSRSGEGFGLVALEAMASGLPVIATSSGGGLSTSSKTVPMAGWFRQMTCRPWQMRSPSWSTTR